VKRRDRGLDPELEAFLKHRTVEKRVPPEIRARALARARATLGPGEAMVPGPVPPLQAPAPMPVASGHGRLRIALAVSVALAGVAVGAVAALRVGRVHPPEIISLPSPPPVPSPPVTKVGGPSREPPTPDVKRGGAANPPRPARPGPKEDPFTAELELLQRAQVAYTRREFSLALALIADHARRFPRGHLAEQREALRVRSLLGSGRADEAHRAAAAFAVRFPRSVLLPQVEGSPESSAP
jgi:hypothetical protein